MTCVLQVILVTSPADTILLVGRNNISMKSGNIFQGLKTIQSRGIPLPLRIEFSSQEAQACLARPNGQVPRAKWGLLNAEPGAHVFRAPLTGARLKKSWRRLSKALTTKGEKLQGSHWLERKFAL